LIDETGWSCAKIDGKQTWKYSQKTARDQEKTKKYLVYDIHKRSTRFWSNMERCKENHQWPSEMKVIARCSSGKWRN